LFEGGSEGGSKSSWQEELIIESKPIITGILK
jgi:hypothetical protein